jgi:predicted nucleic acid-binding protein
MIFLDTSAIYVLADKSDPNHTEAYKKFSVALKSGEQFLIHNYILVECVALPRARLGLELTLRLLHETHAFHIEWVDAELHQEAEGQLEKIGQRGISLVDCTSFVAMRRRGMKKALAFDADFSAQGFISY